MAVEADPPLFYDLNDPLVVVEAVVSVVFEPREFFAARANSVVISQQSLLLATILNLFWKLTIVLMHRKQIYTILVGLGLVAFAFFSKSHYITSPREQVSGSATIVYDKSIKAQYDTPIKVAQAIDGDTIVLINGEHMRYIGVDTPEEFDTRKPVQCFAREAAARNRELVEGKTITFKKDISTYDKYGRWLGFVYLPNGTMVNEELVREGYAFAYDYKPDITLSKEFHDAENYAKANKLGLWGACTITILSSGREQTNPIQ